MTGVLTFTGAPARTDPSTRWTMTRWITRLGDPGCHARWVRRSGTIRSGHRPVPSCARRGGGQEASRPPAVWPQTSAARIEACAICSHARAVSYVVLSAGLPSPAQAEPQALDSCDGRRRPVPGARCLMDWSADGRVAKPAVPPSPIELTVQAGFATVPVAPTESLISCRAAPRIRRGRGQRRALTTRIQDQPPG
jgi:hypothetical protein